MKKVWILISLVLSLAFISTAYAATPDSSGLRISPTLIDERADMGKTLSRTLTVTNFNKAATTFYLTLRDVTQVSNESAPVFTTTPPLGNGQDVSSWIKLSQTSITVAANKTVTVPFNIVIPANTTPGGHFGGIVVSSQPPTASGNSAVVSYGASTIIAMRVNGTVVEKAEIREFTTNKWVYFSPEITFRVNVENIGNVLVRPRGPLEITNMVGKKIAVLTMNDSNGAVFPKSNRQFSLDWKNDGMLIGRYQAAIGLVYGVDGKNTIYTTTNFWVLPKNILLPIIITLLVLFLIIYISVKVYVKRSLSRSGQSYGRAKQSSLVLKIVLGLLLLIVLFGILGFTMLA